MFEEASSSAATEREIQSVGGFGIGQSGSLAGEAGLAASGLPPLEDPEPSSDAEALSVDVGRLCLAPLERSLRAQPVPL